MSGNMIPIAGESKKRICYFFDSDIGNYHYGPGHPMKPHRIRMTHALVMNYGLYKKMEIFRAKPATRKEMAQFHTDDYVDFLSKVTPDNMDEFLKEQAKFNLGDDCPVFDGLFEYCSISAGGSMEGAARLSRDKCDIAVNWAGGLHHAKKAEANGFCYVNDIVLGILELLRYHKRVLYVDIDVHHGDGVEEAFYTTDRVMTCSFHKYGEFFPGTGELRDTGHGKGKYYAVNFPLRDGITDEAYKNIFEPVITKIMETYQPSAIVLQCGGDSLSGDRLGSFNVSMRGHANCVRFIKSLGLPLLLLGGGGYTIRNVSRTWAYETGLAAGQELCPDIPMNEYYEYYGPTYRLDVPPSNMEDMNITKYLEKTKIQIFENLRHTIPVPSVGLQAIPRLPHDEMDVDEDLDDPNERKPQRLLDGLIQRDDEFSDSEDEGEGGRRNVQSHKRARRQSPKLNGNGMLGLHPGSHNPLSQTQRAPDLNFNRLAPSRHSSLSSSATTSIKDIQMIHNSETSSNNAVPIPQNYKTLGPTPHTTSQNKESKPTLADLSHSSASPLAQAPAMVDMPMLSQDDQIELEKLASEALATSPELHPTKQPEEPSKATKMDIDEAVPKSIVIDAEQVKPFTSSVGLGITQAESGGSNGSRLKENTCSNPQTTLVAQRALDNDSQPLTTGLTQPSETIPAAQSENLSTAIQSHITHSDPLEGVTDEFVSEIAQAIAEGEAATGSQAIIPCPPSTSVAGNSNPDLDSVKKDSEIMDPRLKPISDTSFQWSSQGSLNRNHDESMQVDEFQDPDRLAIETTTPIDTDDGDEKFQSEGAHENADTSDHKGSQEAAKNLENRSLIPSIDPLTADTSISISVPSPLPPPPPPCNITSNLNDSHTKDQQKHLP